RRRRRRAVSSQRGCVPAVSLNPSSPDFLQVACCCQERSTAGGQVLVVCRSRSSAGEPVRLGSAVNRLRSIFQPFLQPFHPKPSYFGGASSERRELKAPHRFIRSERQPGTSGNMWSKEC